MQINKLQIIEVKSELGAGKRGASLGPDALKLADSVNEASFYLRKSILKVADYNDELLKASESPFAKYIRFIKTVNEQICAAVEQTLREGKFPFIVSGDHSNATGTIAGLKNFYPDKKLGVIWIDAHADMHSPFTTPSGNMHGMPIACSLGLDNVEGQINNVNESEMQLWEELKHVGTKRISPKINPENLVFIGIRDLEEEEWDLIAENNIRFFPPREIKARGIAAIAKDALEHLSSMDLIYISFDVDSLDSSISYGTGTPSPYGLTEEEATDLIYLLTQSPKLTAFEITEINPLLDRKNNTAEISLNIIKKIFNQA
jgi:arginase